MKSMRGVRNATLQSDSIESARTRWPPCARRGNDETADETADEAAGALFRTGTGQDWLQTEVLRGSSLTPARCARASS
ncbi:hypothetical protein BCAR13_110009 [Paraburkholderia caribensis]|nr:hypothetical protein BCAR13_110009 [Paraburkholderia caribensis]